MSGEFGHHYVAMPGLRIDAWGSGPFVVVAADGKSYRFEDSDRFGPALVKRNGDPLANPYPPERCAFWRAHRIWVRQGRRLEDGVNCIWDEPEPDIVRHIGGRNFMHVEAGEEDGITMVLSADGARVPMREYLKRRPLSSPDGKPVDAAEGGQ